MNNTLSTTEKRPTQNGPHPAPRESISPRVNITENKEGYLLEAEMPGVGKDGLEILLEGNEITLIGRRVQETSDLQPLYRESKDRDYRRTFVLDPTIDTGKVEARMEHGVLKLHLPKAETVKPRKINVTE